MSDAPKSGIRVVGLRLAEYGEVPPPNHMAGKKRCDGCRRVLKTWDKVSVVVYGSCVLCKSCHRGLCGISGEQEMAAQEADVMRMFQPIDVQPGQ